MMNYNDRNFISTRENYTGNINDTDPTAQARVIINALIDWPEFEKQQQLRRDSNRNGYKLFYDLPTSKKDRSIIRGDLMFQVKRPGSIGHDTAYDGAITGTIADDGKPRTMATLNSAGFFDPHNKVADLLRSGDLSPESYANFITSHFQILGISNAYWNYDDGTQNQNDMDGFTIQSSGVAFGFVGCEPIHAGSLVVARAPRHDKLHTYYPNVNGVLNSQRSDTAVFMSLEPYNPDREFSIESLYKRHRHKFESCIGYTFPEDFDYLPSNYDIFDYDMSMEGYHRALYSTIYATLALYDSLTELYDVEEVEPSWNGPINGLHVQKALLETQKKIVKGTQTVQRKFLTERDKLVNKRLHMGTLIAMDSVYFPHFTGNYTCNAAGLDQALLMRNTIGRASQSLFTIHHNMLKNLQSSIIGIALSSGNPGGRIDIQLGLGRQVA